MEDITVSGPALRLGEDQTWNAEMSMQGNVVSVEWSDDNIYLAVNETDHSFVLNGRTLQLLREFPGQMVLDFHGSEKNSPTRPGRGRLDSRSRDR